MDRTLKLKQLKQILSAEDFKEYQRLRNLEKCYKYNGSNNASVKRHRYRVKQRLIEYKGGKCIKCGYDKPCTTAFVFHHRDPLKKDFGLGAKMTSTSFEKLKAEVDKCDLMCSRCHGELHDEEYEKARNKYAPESLLKAQALRQQRKNLLQKYSLNIDERKICPMCNKEFLTRFPMQQYCCHICSHKSGRKVLHPTKENLKYEIDAKTPWAHLGKKYGVSDNAVKKWAKQYGILPTLRSYKKTNSTLS